MLYRTLGPLLDLCEALYKWIYHIRIHYNYYCFNINIINALLLLVLLLLLLLLPVSLVLLVHVVAGFFFYQCYP